MYMGGSLAYIISLGSLFVRYGQGFSKVHLIELGGSLFIKQIIINQPFNRIVVNPLKKKMDISI